MRRRRHLLFIAALVLFVMVAPVATAAWTADPARDRQWDLDKIGAPAAWRVGTGTDVVVAVVDSGVDLHHEDLVGRLVPGHDFVDGDADPQDEYGHGTHVAGIIAATAGNGRGISGVAPGAKIMPVRVLGPDGSGKLDDVVAGVKWAIAHGAKVVNLSLGEDTQALLGPSFSAVLDQAWKAGVVPVVAAGNQFVAGSGFHDEPALVVAATDRDDAKPTYSSGVGAARWGISAPGGELPDLGVDGAIFSTYWTGKAPNQYAYLAGTSQAAPHVAAAVALLLATGRFTPTQAVHRLLDTARDIGAPGRDPTFGAGRLDLAAATAGLPSASPHRAEPAPGAPATTVGAAGRGDKGNSGVDRAPAVTSTTVPGTPAPSLSTPSTPATPTTAPTPGARGETELPRHDAQAAARPAASHDDGDSRWLPAAIAAALALAAAGATTRIHRRDGRA